MKKIVSLITAFALILQLGIVSAFAVPVDNTKFKSTSEIFGIYDCSFSLLSILQVEKEGIVPYARNFEENDFYEITDFTFSLLNYQLSNDKKTVAAHFTTYYDGVQYNCQYVFKKDAEGRVYFNAVDYQGTSRNIYKTYEDADSLYTYMDSPAFSRTLAAEKTLSKKASEFDTQIEKNQAAFEDNKSISTENYLLGYYCNADESQYIKLTSRFDYNTKTYLDYFTYTRVIYSIGTKSYYLNAKSFIVSNGVATYLQDSKNYMEITAPNRKTVTNIKIVSNGKVVLNQKINLTLSN